MMPTEDQKKKTVKSNLPGYPVYAPSQDIYSEEEKVTNINPDDNSEIVENKPLLNWNEEDYNSTISGDDLDVPGSEMDDKAEANGDEDEENNYYSLGGDNHADLDESHGE